jgi:hypothetical protein
MPESIISKACIAGSSRIDFPTYVLFLLVTVRLQNWRNAPAYQSLVLQQLKFKKAKASLLNEQ